MVTGGDLYESLKEYEKDNYFLKDEQGNPLEPEKIGEGWAHLGPGAHDIKIDESVYRDLKAGKNPLTGEQSVQAGVNGEHRAGYNRTFAPDKSWTLYAATSPDAAKLVQDVHNKAMGDVTNYFQSDLAQARQTTNGITEPVKTGNILAMRIDHTVNNAGEAFNHSHLAIFNQTYNGNTDKWQALHSDAFHGSVLTQLYENQMAYYGKEAGLPIGWKSSDSGHTQYAVIAGGQAMQAGVEATSGRAQQVDQYFMEHKSELQAQYPNASDGELKQIVTNITRQDKVSMTPEQIDAKLVSELAAKGITKADIAQGVQQEAVIAKEAANDYIPMNGYELVQAAADALTKNNSYVSQQDLLEASARMSRGDVSMTEMQTAINDMSRDGDIVKLSDSHHFEKDGRSGKGGREYNDQAFTTPRVQAEERYTMRYSREGQGKLEPVMSTEKAHEALKAYTEAKQQEQIKEGKEPTFALTEDQTKGVVHIAASPDSVTGIIGDSGVGKTTMLAAAKSITEQEGFRMIGLAPTGQAAKEMSERTGMDSYTVDKFSVELGKGNISIDGKTILVVDEIGMLGSLKTAGVMHAAEGAGARIVGMGDDKQFQSIDQGKVLSDLVSSGAMNTVRMTENVRQRGTPEYQQAMRDLADKKVDKAMDRLVSNGKIHEIEDKQERMAAMVKDYLSGDYKNTIILTQLNVDKNVFNAMIREGLKADGRLNGDNEYTFTIREAKNVDGVGQRLAQSYEVGNVLRGHHLPGVKDGTGDLRVTAVDQNTHSLTVTDKTGKEYSVDLRRDGDKIANIYAERQDNFVVGDKMVLNRNDEGLRIQNGNNVTLKEVDSRGNVIVKMENGREVKFNPETQYNYFSHGYAVSEYKSQGGSWQASLVHAPAAEASYNAKYVSMSRGTKDMRVYTDNEAGLREGLKHELNKVSTQEFEKTEQGKVEERETSKAEFSEAPGRETQGTESEKASGQEQDKSDQREREASDVVRETNTEKPEPQGEGQERDSEKDSRETERETQQPETEKAAEPEAERETADGEREAEQPGRDAEIETAGYEATGDVVDIEEAFEDDHEIDQEAGRTEERTGGPEAGEVSAEQYSTIGAEYERVGQVQESPDKGEGREGIPEQTGQELQEGATENEGIGQQTALEPEQEYVVTPADEKAAEELENAGGYGEPLPADTLTVDGQEVDTGDKEAEAESWMETWDAEQAGEYKNEWSEDRDANMAAAEKAEFESGREGPEFVVTPADEKAFEDLENAGGYGEPLPTDALVVNGQEVDKAQEQEGYDNKEADKATEIEKSEPEQEQVISEADEKAFEQFENTGGYGEPLLTDTLTVDGQEVDKPAEIEKVEPEAPEQAITETDGRATDEIENSESQQQEGNDEIIEGKTEFYEGYGHEEADKAVEVEKAEPEAQEYVITAADEKAAEELESTEGQEHEKPEETKEKEEEQQEGVGKQDTWSEGLRQEPEADKSVDQQIESVSSSDSGQEVEASENEAETEKTEDAGHEELEKSQDIETEKAETEKTETTEISGMDGEHSTETDMEHSTGTSETVELEPEKSEENEQREIEKPEEQESLEIENFEGFEKQEVSNLEPEHEQEFGKTEGQEIEKQEGEGLEKSEAPETEKSDIEKTEGTGKEAIGEYEFNGFEEDSHEVEPAGHGHEAEVEHEAGQEAAVETEHEAEYETSSDSGHEVEVEHDTEHEAGEVEYAEAHETSSVEHEADEHEPEGPEMEMGE